MRITVVGGNSGTGAEVIRIAAQEGHEVTCLSRSGATSLPEGVRDVTGDARDSDVVRAAIASSDAVVVTVGGRAGPVGTVLKSPAASSRPCSPSASGD